MKKIIFAFAIAAMAAVSMTGCGNSASSGQSEPKPFIDVTDDGLRANFDGTGKGTMGGSGITIGEGEYLVIDSGLTSGKVQVTVKSGGDDINSVPTEDESTPTIDHEFEEAGTTEYRMIEPGNYMVVVKVNEKADGKIDFIVRSDKEGEENAPTTEEQATTE